MEFKKFPKKLNSVENQHTEFNCPDRKKGRKAIIVVAFYFMKTPNKVMDYSFQNSVTFVLVLGYKEKDFSILTKSYRWQGKTRLNVFRNIVISNKDFDQRRLKTFFKKICN